jgi:hypothetical protein
MTISDIFAKLGIKGFNDLKEVEKKTYISLAPVFLGPGRKGFRNLNSFHLRFVSKITSKPVPVVPKIRQKSRTHTNVSY